MGTRRYLTQAVFRLQITCREPAHREPIDQVEWKLSGGVMPARQIENPVRQFQLPEVIQHLPRVHRKERAVVAGPDQQRLQIAPFQPVQIAGRD